MKDSVVSASPHWEVVRRRKGRRAVLPTDLCIPSLSREDIKVPSWVVESIIFLLSSLGLLQ
jgi:hypothetical protein